MQQDVYESYGFGSKCFEGRIKLNESDWNIKTSQLRSDAWIMKMNERNQVKKLKKMDFLKKMYQTDQSNQTSVGVDEYLQGVYREAKCFKYKCEDNILKIILNYTHEKVCTKPGEKIVLRYPDPYIGYIFCPDDFKHYCNIYTNQKSCYLKATFYFRSANLSILPQSLFFKRILQ